jgi:PAS domain S-box-containing protein
MNVAAERMLGWTQRELVGRNMHDVIHPRHPDGAYSPESPVARALSMGQPYRNPDDIFMRKDGTPIPVEYTSSPIVTGGTTTGVILAFHDISDRKRQEEELRAQREWLQVALSSIGDAVIATDTSGAITFINPIAAELTGWKIGDVEGRELTEVFRVIDEQTGEPGPNPVAQVLETRGVVGQASNILLVSSHGREIPIDDSAAPIRDTEGNMIGVILVFHDITDRKRAEDALRRSNQRITRILESIGDAFIALDRDWRFTYVNAKAAQIFARLKNGTGDLVGKVLWAEFPDLIWTDLYDPFHQAVREQRPVAFETHYPEAGGWFGFHAYPSFDSLSVFIQDITDRKHIEGERTRLLGEAQESERRFRELVNTLAGIFWEADAHTLAFSFVSDRARDILGYPVERWLKEPDFWSTIIFEEDRETVLETVRAATEAGMDHDFLYRAVAADGRIVKLRDIVYVVRDEHGRPDRLRGVMVEVLPQAADEDDEPVADGDATEGEGAAEG